MDYNIYMSKQMEMLINLTVMKWHVMWKWKQLIGCFHIKTCHFLVVCWTLLMLWSERHNKTIPFVVLHSAAHHPYPFSTTQFRFYTVFDPRKYF